MPDVKEELMQYRLSMARERLHSAEILLQDGSYKDSIGRSYYAMFTAVRALLAMDGQDFSRHAGVIAYFQKEYIKTGKFDKKFSKYISQAFQKIMWIMRISFLCRLRMHRNSMIELRSFWMQ